MSLLPLVQGAEGVLQGLVVFPLELQDRGKVVHPRSHAMLVIDATEDVDGQAVAVGCASQVILQPVDDAQVVVASSDTLQVSDL